MKLKPVPRLKTEFKEHCADIGLTPLGIANATGLTETQINELWSGHARPNLQFATAAIIAGLAKQFDDVLVIPDVTHKATPQDVAA